MLSEKAMSSFTSIILSFPLSCMG